MVGLATSSFMISMLTITEVVGCAVLPSGQARSRNFTVAGFALPVNMVYSSNTAVRTMVSGIAAEQQGRSALLPDAIISNILGQLMTQINYEALEYKEATVVPTPDMKSLAAPSPQSRCCAVQMVQFRSREHFQRRR
ncbi:hypothetical protein KIN20_018692 [Parelaphostrongylus tenuis]|uniref:Uncharacterized protein n=1 Tax=Parelaphostrongylus tenuis TaxID=148309 RepID=A0AAD5QSC8_PARTN|nr:hypothetical protein KIN20_018692 [Parelaphostrongylus tenuis]